MTRHAPMDDWVVYIMMIGIFAATLYGKHLIARGDQPIEDVLKEDMEEIENEIEDIIQMKEGKIT